MVGFLALEEPQKYEKSVFFTNIVLLPVGVSQAKITCQLVLGANTLIQDKVFFVNMLDCSHRASLLGNRPKATIMILMFFKFFNDLKSNHYKRETHRKFLKLSQIHDIHKCFWVTMLDYSDWVSISGNRPKPTLWFWCFLRFEIQPPQNKNAYKILETFTDTKYA